MWVVKDRKQVWESPVFDVDRPPRSNQQQKFAPKGPLWGPDILVDVVVRIHDPKGNTWLLRARDQKITKTQ